MKNTLAKVKLFPDSCNNPGLVIAETDAIWQLMNLKRHQKSERRETKTNAKPCGNYVQWHVRSNKQSLVFPRPLEWCWERLCGQSMFPLLLQHLRFSRQLFTAVCPVQLPIQTSRWVYRKAKNMTPGSSETPPGTSKLLGIRKHKFMTTSLDKYFL